MHIYLMVDSFSSVFISPYLPPPAYLSADDNLRTPQLTLAQLPPPLCSL